MKNNIKGVGVALVTPFTEDLGVDYDSLGRLVDHVTAGGVDYLVALGTTAETPALEEEEKRDILAYIKERNTASLPLVVGMGGNSTRAVVKAIERADFDGVDAILSVTPYYNKPTQQGLYEHYKAIAAASPVPVILYNVPGRTGVNMTAATTVRIATEIDNILGIKEACGSLSQCSHLLRNRPEGFRVISGDDGMAMSLNQIGGDGVISVVANAFPREFVEMCRCGESASSLHMRLFELIEALFREGNPGGIKAVLSIKGMTANRLRLPLVPVSDSLMADMRRLIEENGL